MPGRFGMMTFTGGPGLSAESLLDTGTWQARWVGEHSDFNDAEDLAMEFDRRFRARGSFTAAGIRVVSFQRSGSAPTPLLVDDAERHHFVASYLATVQSE